jgi:hypothetical protein
LTPDLERSVLNVQRPYTVGQRGSLRFGRTF